MWKIISRLTIFHFYSTTYRGFCQSVSRSLHWDNICGLDALLKRIYNTLDGSRNPVRLWNIKASAFTILSATTTKTRTLLRIYIFLKWLQNNTHLITMRLIDFSNTYKRLEQLSYRNLDSGSLLALIWRHPDTIKSCISQNYKLYTRTM